jgi:DUF4097 and DUF4098 domain-containing protein YvlB
MWTTRVPRISPLLGLLLLFFWCGDTQAYELSHREVLIFPFAGKERLEIRLSYGRLVLRPWKKSSIRVELEKVAQGVSRKAAEARLKQMDWVAKELPNGLQFYDVGLREGNPLGSLLRWTGLRGARPGEIRAELRVPEGIQLFVRITEGSIDMDSLVAEVELECTTGEVQIRHLKTSALNVKLHSGEIRLSDISGDEDILPSCQIQIVEGGTEVQRLFAERLMARSDEATLYFVNCTVNEADIRAGRGDVYVFFPGGNLASWNVESRSGDLFLRLPDDLLWSVLLDTADGILMPIGNVGPHFTGISRRRFEWMPSGDVVGQLRCVSETGDIYLLPGG